MSTKLTKVTVLIITQVTTDQVNLRDIHLLFSSVRRKYIINTANTILKNVGNLE